MLPSLTSEQRDELVRESQGRAVSYVDSPDWFCGQRRSTHIGRDGMTPEKYGDLGTLAALAGTMNDRCREYQYLQMAIVREQANIRVLTVDYEKENLRKTPRKRVMSDILRGLQISQQDLRNSKEQLGKLIAKHFTGFEGRLLIS